MVSCEICSKVFESPSNGAGIRVICDGPCRKEFHAFCVDLGLSVHSTWTAKVGLLWFCRTCRLDFDPVVQRRDSDLKASIRDLIERVDSIDENVKQIKQMLVTSAGRDEDLRQIRKAENKSHQPDSMNSNSIEEDISARITSLNLNSNNEDRTADFNLNQEDNPGQINIKVSKSNYSSETSSATEHVDISTDNLPLATICDKETPTNSGTAMVSLRPISRDKEKTPTQQILEKVVPYLAVADMKRLRLVCKEWKSVLDNDSSFIGKISLNFSEEINRDFNPKSLPPISTLSFDKSNIFAVESWWSTHLGKHLKHLTLSKNCRVSIANLLKLLQQTPNLNSLKLMCGSKLTYHTSNDAISKFQLKKMEILQLKLAPHQKGILPLFGRVFSRLRDFKLLSRYDDYEEVGQMMQAVQDTLENISLDGPSRVLQSLPKFKHLKQAAIEITTERKAEGSLKEHVLYFSRMQPWLEDLYLGIDYPWQIKAQSLTAGCELDHKTLAQLIGNLPELKRLSLRHITDRPKQFTTISLQALQSSDSNRLAQLEYLAIRGFRRGVQTYQSLSFNGVEIPHLTELYLDSTSPTMLPKFLKTATNLRDITLNNCTLQKWSDLFVPIQSKTWRSLKLYYVTAIQKNDDCLYEYLDELRQLELYNCQMSKKMLLTLFRLCPRVEGLIYFDYEISCDDELVLMVCQKMKELQKLSINGRGFANISANHIIKNGLKLEQLLIWRASYCSLSEEVKTQLKNTIPLVQMSNDVPANLSWKVRR